MQLSRKRDDIMTPEKFYVKTCRCPHCRYHIGTRIPDANLFDRRGYMDSTLACPSCRKLIYRAIYPNGRITVKGVVS